MGEFQLLLFSTEPGYIRRAVAAGVHGVIVDWEYRGKELRQTAANTQINRDTYEDLVRVRAHTKARVLCRINGYGDTTRDEIERAVEARADEIFLPMVRRPVEVERVLGWAAGRCETGILIETVDALRNLKDLSGFPLSRVYVGLNDLAIERRTPGIFTAVVDGMVEKIRTFFPAIPFGFGGLTCHDCGTPLPCRLLIGEMARLGCSFSFLRRSFHADMKSRRMATAVPALLGALAAAGNRTDGEIVKDREELERVISDWPVEASIFRKDDHETPI